MWPSTRLRKVILRSAEEKADLELSWSRPDEEFFASGACHVLAAAFLMTYPEAGFQNWGIWPKHGHRGGHVVVVREDLVFDWAGYCHRAVFLAEYFEALRAVFPTWDADFLPIDRDPIGWDFCQTTNARHPSRFRHDPLPRALAFVRRFPPPPGRAD